MRDLGVHLLTRTVDPCGNVVTSLTTCYCGEHSIPKNGAYQTLRHSQQSTSYV